MQALLVVTWLEPEDGFAFERYFLCCYVLVPRALRTIDNSETAPAGVRIVVLYFHFQATNTARANSEVPQGRQLYKFLESMFLPQMRKCNYEARTLHHFYHAYQGTAELSIGHFAFPLTSKAAAALSKSCHMTNLKVLIFILIFLMTFCYFSTDIESSSSVAAVTIFPLGNTGINSPTAAFETGVRVAPAADLLPSCTSGSLDQK
jgi:hypothetical protein